MLMIKPWIRRALLCNTRWNFNAPIDSFLSLSLSNIICNPVSRIGSTYFWVLRDPPICYVYKHWVFFEETIKQKQWYFFLILLFSPLFFFIVCISLSLSRVWICSLCDVGLGYFVRKWAERERRREKKKSLLLAHERGWEIDIVRWVFLISSIWGCIWVWFLRAFMDTKGRLVAGSHNRNEFVLINADEIGRVSSFKISPFFNSIFFISTRWSTPFLDFKKNI